MKLTTCSITVTLLAFAFPALAAPEKPATRPATTPVKAPTPRFSELKPADRDALKAGLDQLGKQIDIARHELAGKPDLLALMPDVLIYQNAVRYPAVYNDPIDVKKAKAALAYGLERLAQLREGKSPWVRTGGPRGYVSRIDQSVQPYLLTMPRPYDPGTKDGPKKYRLDFFCHGRGETLTELAFISGKGDNQVGASTVKFLVHPYGRFCNANKFAGEIDTLEILDSLKKQYPIDDDRVVMSGFSMGGAATWHLAVHYADLWAAASPGAGFAETRLYQHLSPEQIAATPWYERTLWHWYDATDWADDLAQCPTISYAGRLDPQQQSGDVMEKAMEAQGLKLQRVYGPNTKHAYEKGAKAELDQRIDAIVDAGRRAFPETIRFTTFTLRYNHMDWVTVDALEKHWERAHVDAAFDAKQGLTAKTANVAAVTFTFPAGHAPFVSGSTPTVTLDGTALASPTVTPEGAWSASYARTAKGWMPAPAAAAEVGLHKRHGLQGPIDDAFMDAFLFVRPTGEPMHPKTGAWAEAELTRAIEQWRSVFRGEARVKKDDELTDADIADNNLVLWGDPSSNKLLAKIADRLPMKWTPRAVTLGNATFAADTHAGIAIYPNPLNPKHYVVLNSGFTFREGISVSNSRQVPKLPDWAIVDVTTPADSHTPGKIAAAGFFDEAWKERE